LEPNNRLGISQYLDKKVKGFDVEVCGLEI